VDNGYDAISWTTGETQFNRYGSSEIAWVKGVGRYSGKDGWKVKATEQRGGEVGGIDIEGAARAEGILREGGMHITSKEQLRDIVENTLMDRERGQWSPENFEKQVDKLTSRVWERMQKEDAGTSLPRKEGMEGFYDKMMVQIKTWKKLGLKVESDFLLTEKTRKMVFEVYDERGGTERTAPTVSRHDSLEGAAAATRGNPNLLHREAWAAGKGATPTHLVGFTPEMKAKVLDTGLSRFMPDAAAPNTLKNQLGWSLIKGQGNKWRVYKPNGTLAGIAATKASAERMFRTKYKRELRKADK
jgi:hypothetical protein